MKQPLSLLLFDIDFFKRFNDNYGHPAGDECIKRVAEAVKACFNRPGDIVGRYGGEEFIVLLPNTDQEGTEHVAETLRKTVADLEIEHIGSPDHGIVTVSIGGCSIKYTTGSNVANIIARADEALYEAKNHGRNTCKMRELENLHRVLLVDKSSCNIDQIKLILKDHCQLIHVRTVEEAKASAASSMPDLAIVVVNHATDTNIATYHQVKEMGAMSHVPLILLSDVDKNELKSIGRSLNANGNIKPPIDAHKLIATVNQFLGTA